MHLHLTFNKEKKQGPNQIIMKPRKHQIFVIMFGKNENLRFSIIE